MYTKTLTTNELKLIQAFSPGSITLVEFRAVDIYVQ